MGKSIIFMFFFFVAFAMQVIFAQNWFPVGATWYRDYTRSDAEIGEDGYPVPGTFWTVSEYDKYEVVKDTIVNGLSAKLIAKTFHSADGNVTSTGSLIFREENNKVYYYNHATFGLGESDDKFHLMYDFNLEVGDTLKVELPVHFEEDKDRHIVLVAITTEDYGGIPLKVQHLVLYDKDGISEFWKRDTIKITEKLIHRCTMFPFKEITVAPVADGNFYCDCAIMEAQRCDLRCYLDDKVNYHTDINIPCDTVFDTRTGIEELVNIKIKVIYNEVFGTWSVDNSDEVELIEIVDVTGNVLGKIFNHDARSNIEVNLAKYHFGTYFFKISTKNKQYFYKVNRY